MAAIHWHVAVKWNWEESQLYFFRWVNSASSGQQSEPCRVVTEKVPWEKVVNDRCVFETLHRDRRGDSTETPPSFCLGIICKYQSLTKFRRFSAFVDEIKRSQYKSDGFFCHPTRGSKSGSCSIFWENPIFVGSRSKYSQHRIPTITCNRWSMDSLLMPCPNSHTLDVRFKGSNGQIETLAVWLHYPFRLPFARSDKSWNSRQRAENVQRVRLLHSPQFYHYSDCSELATHR
jgi:hypothetical protein